MAGFAEKIQKKFLCGEKNWESFFVGKAVAKKLSWPVRKREQTAFQQKNAEEKKTEVKQVKLFPFLNQETGNAFAKQTIFGLVSSFGSKPGGFAAKKSGNANRCFFGQKFCSKNR